jgi:hypothetical protein
VVIVAALVGNDVLVGMINFVEVGCGRSAAIIGTAVGLGSGLDPEQAANKMAKIVRKIIR